MCRLSQGGEGEGGREGGRVKSVQTDTRRGRREGGCRVCRLSQGVKGRERGCNV